MQGSLNRFKFYSPFLAFIFLNVIEIKVSKLVASVISRFNRGRVSLMTSKIPLIHAILSMILI